MTSSRLEAFSDGIFGIALTLMAIEIQVPEGHSYLDLIATDTAYFIAYVLSFICIAIYWMSHHHLFQAAEKIDGRVLWANNIFLFFITLIPFSTGWIAESHFARDPVVLYGIIFIASGLTFLGLTNSLIRITGKDSAFARVIRRDKR